MKPELSRRVGKLMMVEPILGLGMESRKDFVDSVANASKFSELPQEHQKLITQAEANLNKGADLIEYLRNLKVSQDIVTAQRGSEENVKIKFVLPLLRFLGYDTSKDLFFELNQADVVVLGKDSKPLLIVEVKSWEEPVEKYLDQCLEYTLKLETPWVLITSGRTSKLYSALINPKDLKKTKPLIQFNFNELESQRGREILKELESLLSKENLNNSSNKLEKISANRIGTNLKTAWGKFQTATDNYKSVTKTYRITEKEFDKLAHNHDDNVREALLYLKAFIKDLAKKYNNLYVRYRSKELGIEYLDTSNPRPKKLGLFGIYPEGAHIAFGFVNFEKLGLNEGTIKKLDDFSRTIENIEQAKELEKLILNCFSEL
ncbi:MAG: type I restriction enzyme HsdR N-terminal domain-containing protein [Patescibacteria group bacterium]|nr:type I restriction enzyme HsdR N-terminal domain-containing protein [Patescibacteria group bacterium]